MHRILFTVFTKMLSITLASLCLVPGHDFSKVSRETLALASDTTFFLCALEIMEYQHNSITTFFSSIGWRLGLQTVTGVVFTTFLLGTFYRSASLYHPQRRAILHLKSQKRKIKNKDKEKNKVQDDLPPFFDFTTLRSKTIRILLASISIASFGLNTPIFFLVRDTSDFFQKCYA